MEIKPGGPYQNIGDGDMLNIEEGAIFFLACCDCGLVHRVEAITAAKLNFSVNKRKTAAVRRRMKEKRQKG